jgi:hypothetical protein
MRHDEPNASHFSARYAERKRAAERARDARPAQPRPCNACGVLLAPQLMLIRCDACQAEHKRIAMADGFDAAEEWLRVQPYQRQVRGEP